MPTAAAPTARRWCSSLPTYMRIDADLIDTVDRLPDHARERVLAGWDKAVLAGVCDRPTLATITEVIVADVR